MEKITVDEITKAVKGKLVSGNPGERITGVSIDSRTVKSGEVFIAIKGDRFDGHEFISKAEDNGAAAIVVKRPVQAKVTIIKTGNTSDALQGLAKYYRRKFSPVVIGITGSNGKTTTKDMVSAILSQKGVVTATKGNLNNLIGLPLTLFNITGKTEFCVLELGTNHPGEIKALARIAQPSVGVIMGIGNAHIQYFRTLKNVLKAKMELVDNLQAGGVAIINNDDYYLRQAKRDIDCDVITFGINKKADVKAYDIKTFPADNRCTFTLAMNGEREHVSLPSFTVYNIYNALAASAVAGFLGCSLKNIAGAISGFTFPGMRMSVIEQGGIKIINDAYNANPTSMEFSLKETGSGFPGRRKIAVIGDMLELGSRAAEFHRNAGKHAYKEGFGIIVTVGNDALHSARGAVDAGMDKKKVYACEGKEEAIKILKNILRKGDIILLKGSRKVGLEAVADSLKEA